MQHILDFSSACLHDREPASETIIRDGLPETVMSPVKVIADKSGQSERSVQLNYKNTWATVPKRWAATNVS
ncbi:hypothetical protein [Paraflavitalea speifideaquila]|uniref:hypothetical protein n=1 Tax=Paraflavitalea speifideaquila TaxID=3076558 RepID=UPI0028E9BB27|nr:hypothetical protein [Paraflavitalea speifideiaquila]